MIPPFHPALLSVIANRFGGIRNLGDYPAPSLYGPPVQAFPGFQGQGGAGYGSDGRRGAVSGNGWGRGMGGVPPVSGVLPNGRVFPGQGRALGLGRETRTALENGVGNRQATRGMMEQNAPVVSPVLPPNPAIEGQRKRFALGGVSDIDIPPANMGPEFTTAPSMEPGGALNPAFPSAVGSGWVPPTRAANPGMFNRRGELRPGFGRGAWRRQQFVANRARMAWPVGSGTFPYENLPSSFESGVGGLYGAFEHGVPASSVGGFSGLASSGIYGGGGAGMRPSVRYFHRGGIVPRGIMEESYARGGVARNLRSVPNLPAPDMIPAALSPGELILNLAQERAVMPRPGMANRLLPEQLRALYRARVKRK